MELHSEAEEKVVRDSHSPAFRRSTCAQTIEAKVRLGSAQILLAEDSILPCMEGTHG